MTTDEPSSLMIGLAVIAPGLTISIFMAYVYGVFSDMRKKKK